MMSDWKPEVLDVIAGSDDLHVSPFRADGVAYGTPTWIWSVVVDGGLYVRAYNGRNSRWYQAAMAQGAGRITVAGRTHEVVFEPADQAVNDRVDAAYEAKYAGSPYLPPMVSAGTRAATVRITPRSDG